MSASRPSIEPGDGVRDDEARLIDLATKTGRQAYAPYSNFAVGVAVRTARGGVYTGCNVENVSYPVGTCAERNAIAAAVAAEGPGMTIDALALVARNAGEIAGCSPCGACRQAIGEFGSGAKVIYRDAALRFRCDPITDLLPGAFSFEPAKHGG